jgi:RNA polymerase sigma-70 factor (ECF subfamily)
MRSVEDHDRFLALLEEHKGILYKVANAYCKDREDRPDLIQEIILQLWRSFGRFDPSYRFSTWMYRVAMNVGISFYRSQAGRRRQAVSIEEFGIDLAAADQVLEEASEEVRLLHEQISKMDELNRALILLYLDGCSYAAMAEILGISVTNVATRISRIKERLQRDLGAEHKTSFQESRP